MIGVGPQKGCSVGSLVCNGSQVILLVTRSVLQCCNFAFVFKCL